jgi:hypothetical protein
MLTGGVACGDGAGAGDEAVLVLGIAAAEGCSCTGGDGAG